MKKTLILAAACILSLLAPQAGRADLVLTLSSTTPDLTDLIVGQTVHFDVTLSGLDPQGIPSDLAFATADAGFDDTLLGSPTSVTPGAIIPDTASFIPVSNTGVAGMLYIGVDPIITNGILFSFDVVAGAAGSGTVTILDADFFDSAGNEFSGNGTFPGGIDISSSLRYAIHSEAVPEPSTLVLLSLGGVVGLSARRFRRSD